ncbi:hypothetical protein MIR68_002052 [Amoeboaphelidium protococcarum]|nr:hypothetical protein MIR68_002052 [Amoeboaphelidium protococcarum]
MGGGASKLSPEKISDLQAITSFDKKDLQMWFKGFSQDATAKTVDLSVDIALSQQYEPAMSKADWLKIYKQYFPFGDPTRFANHMFRVFDQDQDGLVSFTEFMKALSKFKSSSSGAQQSMQSLQQQSQQLEQSQSSSPQQVQNGQMQVLTKSQLERLYWSFNLYDINRDGVVDRDEVFDVLSSLYEMLGDLAPQIEGVSVQQSSFQQTNNGAADHALNGSSSPQQAGSSQINNQNNDPLSNFDKLARARTDYLFNALDRDGDGKLDLEDFERASLQDPIIQQALSIYDNIL